VIAVVAAAVAAAVDVAAVVAAVVVVVVAAAVVAAAVIAVVWPALVAVLFEDPLEQAARVSAAASASGPMICRARTDGSENGGRRIVCPFRSLPVKLSRL
jgi:hypothetical protein